MPSTSANGVDADGDTTCHTSQRRWAKSKLRIRNCPSSVVKRIGTKVGNPGFLVTLPCRRQSCPVCGPAMAKAWADKVRAVTPDENERSFYVTWTLRTGEKGMTIPETFRVITSASSFSILTLRRSVAGTRAQRAWSGILCEYALALDTHKSGAAHRQGIIRVSALPGCALPSDRAISEHLRRNFHSGLVKALKRSTDSQLGSVSLKPLHSVDGASIYCALAEGRHWEVGKEWPFAPRIRRLVTSRGFFK